MLQRFTLARIGYGSTHLASRQILLPMLGQQVMRRLYASTANPAELTPEEKKNIDKKLRYLNKVGDVPKPPTRSTNGWMLFVNDEFVKAKTDGSVINLSEKTKEASVKWKSMSESEKQVYFDRATVETQRLQEAYAQWLSSLTQEQIVLLRCQQSLQRKKGKQIAMVRDPAKPKRPSSSFFSFLNQRRAALKDEGLIPVEISKRVAQEWKAMSDAEKKPYVDEANKAYQEYAIKSNAYREEAPKPINLSNALKPAKKPKKPAAKKAVKKKKPVKKAVKKPAKKTTKKTAAKKPVKKATTAKSTKSSNKTTRR
ncbi:high mobility group box domain-containing protein [Syncephalis plumigaleata]|nr:high mobility group box domain-containing protein [Syncephalis plumigaleata]